MNAERLPPRDLTKLRDAWYRFMVNWRIVHYSLGIGGTICATAVAAQPALLKTIPFALDTSAWLSAACIGILTTARPHSRANAYAVAWRLLNDALNRFTLDPSFPIGQLLQAATEGERAIQASDPTA